MGKEKIQQKESIEAMPTIETMLENNFNNIVELSDLVFGKKFLEIEELKQQFLLSKKLNLTNSFIAKLNKKIVGYSIFFAPGNWDEKIIKQKCQLDKFTFPLNDNAYYKSVVVHPSYQNLGIGTNMFRQGIDVAKQQGAKAIIAHIWANSPNNSAFKLVKIFRARVLHVYEKRWREDSLKNKWDCARCGNPCLCDSLEVEILLKD